MITFLQNFNPVVQALLGTHFTWGMTALGASVVFLGRELNRKFLDGTLGFAAGVMLAASYWSLLAPAIELSEERAIPAWILAVIGFLLGSAACAASGTGNCPPLSNPWLGSPAQLR